MAQPELVDNAFDGAFSAVTSAVSGASRQAFGLQRGPHSLSASEWLNPTRASQGSLSIGSVGTGSLVQAKAFPHESAFHQVIERHRGYGTQWGTDEMVEVLLYAAEFAGTHAPGAPLRVGNLSKRYGGDIRWSRSHNSGRDADIAFYVRRVSDNASVVTPELLQFDEHGVPSGRPDLVFDIHRNWLFIKGLVTNPSGVVIQYVFVSEPLKAMLLDHARASGESEDVIARAADVLHQPTDALPHDDHFHLRIACPLEDRLRGCLNSGPQWAWANWWDVELRAQAWMLAKAMPRSTPARQLEILAFLEAIKSPYAADVAVLTGLDATPEVREASFALARGSWTWSGATLHTLMRRIQAGGLADEELSTAYTILRRSVSPEAMAFALGRLQDQSQSERERVLAARCLGHFMDESLVPVLMRELLVQPGAVSQEIAIVVRRIMNHGPDFDWASGSPSDRERTVKKWMDWAKSAGMSRERWLLEGLRENGVRAEALDAAAIDEMMRVLPHVSEHVAYNINRAIRDVTGRWAPLEADDARRVYDYWAKWWKKNRERVLAGRRDGDEGE